MKWYSWIFLGLVIVVYLTLRLGWWNTIEFGYDQPRLATSIQEFLKSGSYITSQNYSLPTPWENLSWGPFLIFFLAVFIKISSDPIVNSLAIACFNLISILTVFYIGKKFFTVSAGLIAAATFAIHPWWLIFSRMFYQPSTIPTFVSIAILFTLLVLDNPKKYFIAILIPIWTFMAQSYLMSLSVVGTSALFAATKLKKINYWWVSLGILISSIFILPEVVYFIKNVKLFDFFLKAPGKYKTSLLDIFINYFKVVGGGNFKWQLGNGYEDFLAKYPYTPLFFTAGLAFFALVLIGYVLLIFRSKNKVQRLFILFCALAAPAFISIVKVEFLVPRYFLISLPAVSLLFGITFSDIACLFKNKYLKIVYFVPIVIFIMWFVFDLSYYTFIGNYDYPHGFLSLYSDTPYVDIVKSVNWVKEDAKKNGQISYDLKSDSFGVNYYMTYVSNDINNTDRGVSYFITYWNPDPNKPYLKRFGPFTIYSGSGN